MNQVVIERQLFCMPDPHIQNVVATFQMTTDQKTIDLIHLTRRLPFIEYNARKFAAAVVRLVNPKTTCLVFASGKGVCAGAVTEQEARLASLKYISLIRKAGVHVLLRNFKVQNIVSAAHCPFRVDLHRFSKETDGVCSYEPTLFPGLMFRKQCVTSNSERVTNVMVFLVFQSGKCVITGGKNRTQIIREWRDFFNTKLLHYVSATDYGTSGDYRTYQHQLSSSPESIKTLRQLASMLPYQMQSADTLPDDEMLLRNLSGCYRASAKLCAAVSKPWNGHDHTRETSYKPLQGRA